MGRGQAAIYIIGRRTNLNTSSVPAEPAKEVVVINTPGCMRSGVDEKPPFPSPAQAVKAIGNFSRVHYTLNETVGLRIKVVEHRCGPC